MINIKFTGQKAVLNRLAKLAVAINTDIPRGLESSSNILRDMSIANLIGSLGTGKWGYWGPSADSIRDKAKWSINKLSPLQVELKCNSEHAAVVELGGFKHVTQEPGRPPFPIGGKQGGALWFGYRRGFDVQQGYSYTRRAMNSKTVQNAMAEDIAKVLRGSIAKVTI